MALMVKWSVAMVQRAAHVRNLTQTTARRVSEALQAAGKKKCMPSAEACNNCGKFPCSKLKMREFGTKTAVSYKKGLLWLGAAGVAYVLANTEVIPLSGRVRLRLVPDFVDRAMAKKYDAQMLGALSSKFLPESSPDYERVVAIGTRLSAVCSLNNLQYHVIDDDTERNAFVSAGGHVVVYTGLLRVLEDDDMLAAVLGHEIGHYLAHHVAERVGFDWLSMALKNVFSDSKPVRYVSALFLTLPKSRLMETEADYMGLLLMAAACYDINAAHALWSKFHSMADVAALPTPTHDSSTTAALIADTVDAEKSGSLYDRYMSTHPTHSQRMSNFSPGSKWMTRARLLQSQRCNCGCKEPSLSSVPPSQPVSEESKSMRARGKESAAPCVPASTAAAGASLEPMNTNAPSRILTESQNVSQNVTLSKATPLCRDAHPVMWWMYCYNRAAEWLSS